MKRFGRHVMALVIVGVAVAALGVAIAVTTDGGADAQPLARTSEFG